MKHLWLGVAFLVACGDGTGAEGPGGGADAALADAEVTDASPVLDAAIDAPLGSVDAAIDAPPDAPPTAVVVTVALAAPPVFTNHGPAQAVFATATNHTAAELALTVTATGDVTLVADGACDHVAAGASCAITLGIDNTTLGARAGALTVVAGGVTATTTIVAKVDAFVGATVLEGDGTVAFDPAPETGCVGGGCYAPGTQVTMSQTPGAGFVLDAWSPQCFGGSCAVVAAATPIESELTYLAGVALHIELSGGPGEVSLFASNASLAQCRATCTVTVDPARELYVYIASAVEVTSIDGVPQGPNADGGGEQTYPAGTPAISVGFSPRPGEVDLFGDDLAFDRDGNLAIAAHGPDGVETVTVYDPAMAAKWSVPGEHVAFTRTGELYVERTATGGATTSKYDADGHLLVSEAIPLGFVTPDGGMLNPGPAANTITRRDAALTVVTTLTLTAPYPGARGCLSLSSTGYQAAVEHPVDGELSFDHFALDGTYLDTRATNVVTCQDVPDWDGDVVSSSFHPNERVASHAGLFVDDLTAADQDIAYGAGVDVANHLYWLDSVDGFGPTGAQGGTIQKYTPPSAVPVATITRTKGFGIQGDNPGVTPRKLVTAPDGRVAWVATWLDAFGTVDTVIQIFAP